MNWFEVQGKNGRDDTEVGYKKGKCAVLDHLVPLAERREDLPAVLLQGEHRPIYTSSMIETVPWALSNNMRTHVHQTHGPPAATDRMSIQVMRYERPSHSDAEDVNCEELACVRDAWQQANDRATEAQELWGERVLYQLEKGVAKVVRVRTSSMFWPALCSMHEVANAAHEALPGLPVCI